MLGLIFLTIALAWLAFGAYVAAKTPQLIGVRSAGLRFVTFSGVFILISIAPFTDEIIGMRQFKGLCGERIAPDISSNAALIKKGERITSIEVRLNNYFIKIYSQSVTYIDRDSGSTFLKYEYLSTDGGKISKILLRSGRISCSAENTEPYRSQVNNIPAYRNIMNGGTQ